MTPQKKLHQLVFAALFAAAIAVMTAYLLHIPIPTGGYLHLGDALIYLAACLLPLPYAIGAAMVGAGLADLLTAPMWVVPTLIIKALVVLPFTSGAKTILCKRNIVAIFLSGIFSAVAYGVAAVILLGSTASFIPQVIGTLIQAVGSGILFAIIGGAMDRAKLKNRLS